jgi:hypothetical protein
MHMKLEEEIPLQLDKEGSKFYTEWTRSPNAFVRIVVTSLVVISFVAQAVDGYQERVEMRCTAIRLSHGHFFAFANFANEGEGARPTLS